jgi:hypothetical protein
MITRELLAECIAIADSLPERYRSIAFEKLVDDAARKATSSVPGTTGSTASNGSRLEASAELGTAALGQMLIDAEKQDRKLLIAIRLLELEAEGDGAPLARIADIFKRYRVRPPGNVPRDVSALIRRGLVIEHSRDNRKVLVVLTNQGLSAIGQ